VFVAYLQVLITKDDPLPMDAVLICTAGWQTRHMTESLTTWICHLCGFVYDEAAGLPSEGFAPGTRWADIPDSWSCPDCGYAKADFEMVALFSD